MTWFSIIKKPRVVGERYGIKVDNDYPLGQIFSYYDNDLYLNDEIWAQISDYPSDMKILERELDKGNTIVDAMKKIIEKTKHFIDKKDDETWSKKTIEEKLGRELTPKDYERNMTFEDNAITMYAISQLILNNPEAKELYEERLRLGRELSKIMQERLQ
jgi:hypothetical protein